MRRRHLTALVFIAATACGKPAAPPAAADAAPAASDATPAAPDGAPAATDAVTSAATTDDVAPTPTDDIVAAAPDDAAPAADEPPGKPLVLTSAAPMGIAPRVLAVDGVPSFDAPAPASNEAADASRTANLAGLERHKLKDWAAAASHYVDALTADPQSVVARYNLACAFARAGDPRAKAVLAQLAAAACPKCLEVVAASARDRDLASLKADPEVVELRKSAAAALTSLRWAGRSTSLEDGGKRVVWRSLGAALQPSEGLDVSWAEPAQVRALHIVGPSFMNVAFAVTADGWPTSIVGFNGGDDEGQTLVLEPSPVTTHLRIMAVSYGGDTDRGPLTFEVLGDQPPPADAAPAPPAKPPAAAPAPVTFEAGKATFPRDGFPMLSADGKHVAFFETEDDDSDMASLRISEVATGKEIGVYTLVATNDEPELDDATAAKREAKGAAQLAALGPWQPMLPVGGGDGWVDTNGDVSGVYAGYDGDILSVASLDGTLSFRHRGWPRQEDTWEREARLHPAPKPPPGEEGGDMDLGEDYSLRWGGAWIDAAHTTLYLRSHYKFGVCAGGGMYQYQTVQLTK